MDLKAENGACSEIQVSGAQGLKVEKRGRRYGAQRKLALSQETKIQGLIKDKPPDQLKLSFALWTRRAVQEMLDQHDFHGYKPRESALHDL